MIRRSALRKIFDAGQILHLHRVPPQLAANILGHRPTLIDEYHHLMSSCLKDLDTASQHLEARGVSIPAKALHTG